MFLGVREIWFFPSPSKRPACLFSLHGSILKDLIWTTLCRGRPRIDVSCRLQYVLPAKFSNYIRVFGVDRGATQNHRAEPRKWALVSHFPVAFLQNPQMVPPK